jgi:hypothetical protein
MDLTFQECIQAQNCRASVSGKYGGPWFALGLEGHGCVILMQSLLGADIFAVER